MSVETFIISNFVNSDDSKDKLHTEQIASQYSDDNGYKIDKIEAGRLINRIGSGKSNRMCNIDECSNTIYYNRYLISLLDFITCDKIFLEN